MMNARTSSIARYRRESGFSIMEVLVALLVLAIGLLGLAALQAQGLRFNQDAYVRSQATHITYDIVDRMRVNRANLAAYTAGDPDPGVDNCNPTISTITMDLSCWYDDLEAALPGADAVITASATANYYDISIRWADRTPRELGGTTRLPSTAGECTAIPNRVWDAGAPVGARCKVTQTWTVRP